MRRRLFCLLPLALLAACEEQPAAVQPEVTDSERVYSPGPIAWEQLSDEHRRRARMMLARHQEAVPEDEDALRTRWNALSPACGVLFGVMFVCMLVRLRRQKREEQEDAEA